MRVSGIPFYIILRYINGNGRARGFPTRYIQVTRIRQTTRISYLINSSIAILTPNNDKHHKRIDATRCGCHGCVHDRDRPSEELLDHLAVCNMPRFCQTTTND